MIEFLTHWLVVSFALIVLSKLFKNFEVDSYFAASLGALSLGFVNAIIKPVLAILTLPLTVITLGLFLFVLNVFLLKIAAALAPGFRVKGFGTALLASILLSLLGLALS